MKKINLTKKTRSKRNNNCILIDQSVGNRLKIRRNIIGLSQDSLAQKIGVSFQQVQKYERGTNRISASRLYEISQVLKVPVSFFFEEVSAIFDKDKTGPTVEVTSTLLNNPESLELVKNFWELPKNSRKNFISLLKEITKNM